MSRFNCAAYSFAAKEKCCRLVFSPIAKFDSEGQGPKNRVGDQQKPLGGAKHNDLGYVNPVNKKYHLQLFVS